MKLTVSIGEPETNGLEDKMSMERVPRSDCDCACGRSFASEKSRNDESAGTALMLRPLLALVLLGLPRSLLVKRLSFRTKLGVRFYVCMR